MYKFTTVQVHVDINAILRSGWVFWSVMAISAIVTGYAYTLTKSHIETRNIAAFKSITDANLEALRVRIQSYGRSLDGAVGLIAASDNVTLADWQHYIKALGVENKLPGIRGIGLISIVPRGQETQFLEIARTDGLEDLQIHPETRADVNFVIKYIEPLLGNEGMVGFNIAVEGGRRLAAIKSRDTGLPTITPHIELAQGEIHQPELTLLRPSYAVGMPTDTVEQRRAASLGWVFAPFISEQLLKKLTIDQQVKFHISVFESNNTNANTLIYNSEDGKLVSVNTDYEASANIQFYGQDWTVIWRSTPEFDASHQSRTPYIVLLAGVLFSIFYTSIIGAMTYREQKVQYLIEKKTLELTAVEERWNLALKGAEIGVFDIDLITEKSVVSDTWKRLMNIPLDDPLIDTQQAFLTKVHPEDLPALQAADAACIDGIADRSICEFRIEIGPDGYRWIKSDAAVVNRDIAGKALRLVGSQTDVTNLHKAREALSTSINSFQALFENAPVGMALINEDAAIIRVNIALCSLLDFSEQELLSKKYWDVMVPEESLQIATILKSIQTSERKTYQSEHQFVGKDGGICWGLASVSLDKDPTTGRDLYIAQIQDINKIKEMENIKNEFVATVSHELRTPLTSVNGALGLLKATMTGPVSDTTERLLNIANSNCNKLTLLVNDILDMEKFASGNFAITRSQEALKSILVASVEHIEPYAQASNISIKLELQPTNLNVWTDSKRVEQIMANLLSNAVKFSNKGGEILVNYEKIKGAVRISVRNFGAGVSEKYKQDIFKPFSQGDSSSTREKGGTGLGLNISRKIVEQLGGEIGFESIKDLYTTFWFTLPLTKSNQTHVKSGK